SILGSLIENVTTTSLRELDAAQLDDFMANKADVFIGNLSRMRIEAQRNGAIFIAVTQQVKSYSIAPEDIRGITYAEERRMLEEKLQRDGTLNYREAVMLTHTRLMDALRKWATEENVPLVDGIRALDQRRDTLVSRVHLSPEGNRILAHAIAEQILAMKCSEN
ncbi:hypothetical protein D6833_12075, partial [Candidatus Parcubacteria bacterium]